MKHITIITHQWLQVLAELVDSVTLVSFHPAVKMMMTFVFYNDDNDDDATTWFILGLGSSFFTQSTTITVVSEILFL